MKLKAIATDVDRTLTDDRERLDLNAVRTIRLLEEAGVPVILCSGRDMSSVGTLSLYMGAMGLVVCEDGALVGSMGGVLHWMVRPLADRDRVDRGLGVLREAYGSAVQVIPIPARVLSYVLLRTLDQEAANRLLAERETGARLLDSGLAFELADSGVDKGRGLIEAAGLINLDVSEIAAVGDNFNDIDMFRVVGWSAAVANAPDAVKAEAAYVCRRPHGQGFVEAVREVVGRYRPDLARLDWPKLSAEPEEAAAG